MLSRVLKKHDAKLYGYVLMANHFHLLVEIDGGPRLCRFMRDLKSLSARQIFPGQGTIWAERFDDVAIVTESQFYRKLSYIHSNPVKAGLVKRWEDWPWTFSA